MKHPANYYSLVRRELFDFIPDGTGSVLEVGCGDGATLAELKKIGKAQRTAGIEYEPAAAARAARVVDQVLPGDAQTMDLPFRPNQFDAILFPDVLEHLSDPWSTLKRFRRFLKPQGRLIVSVPNVRHFSVLRDLLRGGWTYSDAGIMDRTHLRFFTRKTIIEAINGAGYSIETVRANGGDLRGWKAVLDRLSGKRLSPWFEAQYLIQARKN